MKQGLKHNGPIGVQLEDKSFIFSRRSYLFFNNKADCYTKAKQSFVIRLKYNIQLNRKRSLQGSRTKNSNIVTDSTCTLGTPRKQTQQRHRVVESIDYEGKTMRVVTILHNVTW